MWHRATDYESLFCFDVRARARTGLLGAHGGAFFSVGFGAIGLRATAYPGRFGEGDHGFEGAVVFRATIPLLLPVVWVPRTGEVGSAGFTHALGRFPM